MPDDAAELERFNPIPWTLPGETVDPCIFKGHLHNESNVYVALIGGCPFNDTFEVRKIFFVELKKHLTTNQRQCVTLVLSYDLTFFCFQTSCTQKYEKIAISHQWKGINHKQSTRWQHLIQFKASAFFSFQKSCCYETQQLILGIDNAIW